MTRAAARERLTVMTLFVGGHNTAEIARRMDLPESDVERLIHTRTCIDMRREISMLRSMAARSA